MLTNKNKVRGIKFFRVFILFLAAFSVISALITTGYVLVTKNNLLGKVLKNPVLQTQDAKVSAKDKAFTVVAVFGSEQMTSTQTDTNMLVFFNHKNQEINVVSVPRDTKFNWPDELYTEISAKRKDIPKIIPISDVGAYVAADKKNETAVKVLENAFHMNIDYYINMDLAAFKYLVDVTGPVQMETPDIIYSDQAKNLNISISKGTKSLDGETAAQVVRYSDKYPGGDLARLKTQHTFIQALLAEMLKPENKVNIPATLKGVYPYIQTDFENAADYMVYLDQISLDKVILTTLPGSATSDNKYAYDSAKSKALFETILTTKDLTVQKTENKPATNEPAKTSETGSETAENKPAQPTEQPADKPAENTGVVVEEVYDTKAMPIGVYNGTNISGLAAKTKTNLVGKGYKVVSTGNYQTKPVEKTIIKVYAQKIGDELLVYFPGATVQVDPTLKGKPEEIVIVLGLTENR